MIKILVLSSVFFNAVEYWKNAPFCSLLGNCDICVKWNISVIKKEMKV